MRSNLKSIRKRRRYSEEFKKGIVSDFESGSFSVPDLEKLHGIGHATIYNWIYKFSTFNSQGYRVIEMKDSSEEKMKQLQARVKELEGMVGRKQIKIEYLEKMIDIAKAELDIDIKKNFVTPPSGGSGKTNKK